MNEKIRFYKERLGLDDAVFTRIDHNDTMVAVVYKIDSPSRKPLILKICTRDKDYYRELYFLTALTDAMAVPRVDSVVAPTTGRYGAILMESLEGSHIIGKDWTSDLAHDIGVQLAVLHSKRTTMYGDCSKEETLTPNVVQYFQDKFLEELKECEGHLSETTITQCKDFYETHKGALNSVDGPSLVHRDFHPGNILVNKGKLSGIIDWASARFGFSEQDFCSMEHRSWPNNPQCKQALLDGYASVREIPDHSSIMPLLRLGRALAVIGFTVKNGTWNGRNQAIYQFNRDYLDSIGLTL